MVLRDLRKRNNTFIWTTIKITVLIKQEFLLGGGVSECQAIISLRS